MGLGLIPDILGSVFGGKEKGGDLIDTTPKWLQLLGKQLGAQVSGGVESYTPGAAYGGNLNFSGSPTSAELGSLSLLQKFLGDPGTGGLFDQATGQISDTLAGKYADPNTSPFIQSMTKLAKNNLSDLITEERGRRGARGSYFTDAGVQAESKLSNRVQDNLNAIIGDFVQKERNNMLDASKTAANLDQYKNLTLPLAKIGAGQQYGALPRLLEKANLESQYQDFLRQREELNQNAARATTLVTNQPNITPGQVRTPTYFAKNDFGNILDVVNNFMGQFGGAGGAGGGAGGAGGGDMMSKLLPMLLGSF